MEEALRWLDKAIRMESEGKPATLVNKALEKACNLENDAYAKGERHKS